ncbi:hypothetical protein AURDEDRAFT_76672 [Auricularia subglabra TFB-10046 SS5]|uniref:Uncharacterized protein n=1 Tax=Auricularia subglabra (strain TFB-10046 / SS5) TaxID=717982 RepID=J0CU03_AURST|nr:hypothetical protein AURDEDRAFT_76672 [Auricularia subglabra TFB-10046 SS5]
MRAYGPEPPRWITTLLSFDKNCQYWVNFCERIENEFGDDSVEYQIASQTLFCVPKFHISNHIEDCQFQFHPGHVTGAGRVTGEEVEPPWAELGQAGAQSRDSNPGHRQEIIEDAISDWNFKKLVGMGEHNVNAAH